MLRGYYTAAYGMLAQQRRTEMLANNLANANTPGYKTDQATLRAFPEMLIKRFEQKQAGEFRLPTAGEVGPLNTGVYLQETMPKFIQGRIEETELNTDMALIDLNLPVHPESGRAGTVFFTVEHPDGGVRYTRNGNFTLNNEGYLMTASGFYVLDREGGRIQLSSEEFTVDAAGKIQGPAADEVYQLGIAYAEDPLALVKEGDGLFAARENEELPDAFEAVPGQFKLEQRYLEQSNVDAAQTMTQMLAAYRTFEANQKVLQAYDQSMQKTVNEVGKI